MKQRIQKALSQQGLGSRRQIETWINEGKISLNGNPAKIGDMVEPGDRILFGGRKIFIQDSSSALPKVIAYNKPEGEVCTRDDPQGRPNIFQNLPQLKRGRWIMVGRLDINTSGLILLTDNGELANRLMHPSYQLEREYLVRTRGVATEEMLVKLTHGVRLDDGEARFEEVVDMDTTATGSHHWYAALILEGRQREVRRMWEAVGMQVSRLKRVRYGPTLLGKSHRLGRTRELTEKQVIELCDLVGLEYSLPEAAAKRQDESPRHARRPVIKGKAKVRHRDRLREPSRHSGDGAAAGHRRSRDDGDEVKKTRNRSTSANAKTGRGKTRPAPKQGRTRTADSETDRKRTQTRNDSKNKTNDRHGSDSRQHKKPAPKKRTQVRTRPRGRTNKP